MRLKSLWLAMIVVITSILVMAACQPATPSPVVPGASSEPSTPAASTAPNTAAGTATDPAQPTAKPAQETPKYGGTLNIVRNEDPTNFDPSLNTGQTNGRGEDIVYDTLWIADWARGYAGGYGTNEVRWNDDADRWDMTKGSIAESTKWTVDWQNNEGTIVYQIRQGIHWALDQKSEASRLAGGRELTADDVAAHLKRMVTDPKVYIYKGQVEVRPAKITKTGPWEITVKLPLEGLLQAICRFGQTRVAPPEVVQKYGDLSNWKNSVGTGGFMRTEYVPGSQIVYVRNPNYWMKDPVGPGKGNQLPYLDGVRMLIIPDKSTREAALRTGKLDRMDGFNWEDATTMRKQAPTLLEAPSMYFMNERIAMRVDKPPFTDVRVRRAMMMAIDYQVLVKSLHGGKANLVTWPTYPVSGYEDMTIEVDDPEMPASVKELYTYNPEKAKQLLKEAGFPNGFKTSILTPSTGVDYFSIIKDMWAKVGIDLAIDVRDSASINSIKLNWQHETLTTLSTGPPAIFYSTAVFSPDAPLQNTSKVSDPYVNDALNEIRRGILKDGLSAGMKAWRELVMKHILDQVYAIPAPQSSAIVFWWPWVKNYSGELSLGYYTYNYPLWIWYDQALKKSMGY